MLEPLYYPLNIAVVSCCNALADADELRMELTDNEAMCDSLEKITDYYMHTGRVLVWSGASDNTVFGDPRINHLFRAWHDLIHIQNQFPFTALGEYKAYEEHCRQMHMYASVCLTPEELETCTRMLDVEINYQVAYMNMWGEFPSNQRAFMSQHLCV